MNFRISLLFCYFIALFFLVYSSTWGSFHNFELSSHKKRSKVCNFGLVDNSFNQIADIAWSAMEARNFSELGYVYRSICPPSWAIPPHSIFNNSFELSEQLYTFSTCSRTNYKTKSKICQAQYWPTLGVNIEVPLGAFTGAFVLPAELYSHI